MQSIIIIFGIATIIYLYAVLNLIGVLIEYKKMDQDTKDFVKEVVNKSSLRKISFRTIVIGLYLTCCWLVILNN